MIREHSTIGLVVTTDGSVSDIPGKNQPAEARVVAELEELGKPFVILLNCVRPETEESRALAARMEAEYGHAVLPVNCEDLTAARINEILQSVLYEV